MPLPIASRSRQWVGAPVLLRPTTVEAAQRCFDEHPDARPLGGGLDIVNRMKEGWQPGPLVALSGIDALTRITLGADGRALHIGAMVCHDVLANDPLVKACLPDLAHAWNRIANIRIRMQGTIAGNVFAGMPGYEAAVLLAALDAQTMWHAVRRSSSATSGAASGWASGFRIALAHPIEGGVDSKPVTRRLFYDRSLRPSLSVALGIDVVDGVVVAARAVLGGCHAQPIARAVSLPAATSSLQGMRDDADAIARRTFADLPAPTAPWAGDPAYRLRMAPVLLSRLLQERVQ